MAAHLTTSVISAKRTRKSNGDDAMDDEKLVFETSEGVEAISSFDNMGLKNDLLRGLYGYGLEKPSAIQHKSVKLIIDGRDVIAQAQSGTRKTSIIALTGCEMVDTASREYVFCGV